jgi:membrane protein DedA with SNARE-associated domain
MIMFPHLLFPETQATLALSIFLFTFAYEDGATLLAATLAAAGRLDVRLGFASAFLGIWVGDMGLYVLGSTVGRRAASSRWLMRLVPSASLRKAESWFARRGTLTIVMSRFLPGSRLPLYLAAGALRLPAGLFSTITGLCSVIWVTLIFAVWHFAPTAHLASGKMIWWLAAATLLAPWFVSKTIARTIRAIRVAWKKYQHWEFWPAWLFYPPVVAMCAWLAVKYRGLSLPTIANPSFRNGGIVGESKIEVLQSLMSAAPEFVADGYLLPEAELPERLRRLENTRTERSIAYPFVLKPNVGQRGAGFKLVTCLDDAEQYLASVRSKLILQRYVRDEKEIGVFYYRYPGAERGEIFAITEKCFPAIVGDGGRTFEELLDGDDRACLIRNIYLSRFAKLRGRILASGERVRLVEAGNHCQGCIFREGEHLISEALRNRLDQISRSVPGFFIGRYDIRYSSDDDLRRGENFQIIELNGAASEATNIYDERNSLWSAYRMLYKQWDLVYHIGRANRDRGYKPASVLDVLRDLRLYVEMSRSYPAAD